MPEGSGAVARGESQKGRVGRVWKEFISKNRSALIFALGMLLFLGAGLVVRSLPSGRGASSSEEGVKEERVAPALREAEDARSNPAAPQRTVGTDGRVLPVTGDTGDSPAAGTWFLYVTGNVRNPGVYRLPPGSRLFQLVEAAGGLNAFADPTAVNLASLLEDGAHVHIPRRGERPTEESAPTVEARVDAPVRTVGTNRNAASPRKIDVNRASLEELTALKGIGPALAAHIVEYRRKHGRFRSVSDLLQVKGIGEKKLEGFRDSVTVGP